LTSRLPEADFPPLAEDVFAGTSHSPSLIEIVGEERARGVIDFCFIANPYFPTGEMLAGLQASLPDLVKFYPSSNPETTQRLLAEVVHADPGNLVVGNGATEIIGLASRTLVGRIAVPIPTFGEYIEKLADPRAAELYQLPPDQGYQLDPGRYLAWARRRRVPAVLIINPGNPTGQVIPLDEMIDFLTRARDRDLVIVDESFIDFAGEPAPSLLPIADRFDNLLVVSSLSKHFGVPGLRLGYCYSGNPDLLARVRRFLPTWNLNTVAEQFLAMLPAAEVAYQESRRRVMDDVRSLYEGLTTVPGISAYPSGANFVLFRIDTGMTAKALQARLLGEHAMYVRDCSNKVGIDDYHIRVASQGRDRDRALIRALRSTVA
jgi:threonine-phosphate decarboxylase